MKRRNFGHTWWGQAWIDALEGRASLDPNRLPRGRTYARQGKAQEVVLQPGRIVAAVQGSRPRPYKVEIRVRELTAAEWDRFLAVIASKAAHAAALLDGELDPGIDADAREAGVELLPVAGEIQPRCSCPDWADPCKHAAAVCYLAADELDTDPYRLLELRGRTREAVQAGVRAARAVASGAADGGGGDVGPYPVDRDGDGPVPTVRAAEVLARWADGGGEAGRDLPLLPPPLAAPLDPAPWPVEPPAGTGLDGDHLRALARDAAARAWAVLAEGEATMLQLRERHDLARRAAAALGAGGGVGAGTRGGGGGIEALAVASGLKPRALARMGIAWREAGAGGVDLLDTPAWRPPPEALIEARAALVDAGVDPAAIRIDTNRLTVSADGGGGLVQLRYGLDRRWYRLEKRSGSWDLDGPSAADPAELV